MVTDPIAALEDTHLVLVHGEYDTRLPWETMHVAGNAPALLGGVSHRYLAPNRSIAKWNDARDPAEPLRLLIIGNPTGDLDGAEAEARALEELARGNPRLQVVATLYRDEASLRAVEDLLNTREIDVLHYAGHAFFDQHVRANGGLLLAGHEVLAGRRIMALGRLPNLVVLNACEAARVRGRAAGDTLSARDAVEEQGSLAEALLKAGVGSFVGTYWPVGDAAAMSFASRFYEKLAAGECLNVAVVAGRRELHARGLPDWANYVFYGDPGFCFSGEHAA
jgi:CHAT domain-containing protein